MISIDRVVGLETGADDYIPKPFELREVLFLRASELSCAGAGPRAAPAAPVPTPAASGNASEVLVFEGWRLDVLRRELRRQTGDLVPLTAGEFELLCAFARHPNRVLNRDQLIDLVKGREWAAYDRGVDSQVMRLRKKIEADPSNPPALSSAQPSVSIDRYGPTNGLKPRRPHCVGLFQ